MCGVEDILQPKECYKVISWRCRSRERDIYITGEVFHSRLILRYRLD